MNESVGSELLPLGQIALKSLIMFSTEFLPSLYCVDVRKRAEHGQLYIPSLF